MDELKYEPVSHDRKSFLKNAQKREVFSKVYNDLEEEYPLVREMLSARSKSGLTQEAVAEQFVIESIIQSNTSSVAGALTHGPMLRENINNRHH